MQGLFSVERVSDERGMADLQAAWVSLLERIPDHHLFHTWAWLATWHRHHPHAGELYLLAARDSAGELAGLLPLRRVVQRVGPVRVRTLVPLYFRPAAHLTVIAPASDQPAVLGAFLDYLAAYPADWDAIHLDGFDATDEMVAQIAAGPGKMLRRPPIEIGLITLPDKWKTYEMGHLSGNRRRNVRRLERRIARDHPDVAYRQATTPDETASMLGELFEYNRRRWNEAGVKSSFDDDRFVAFNEEIAPLALERGWLRLYRLEIDGEMVAVNYCLAYNGLLCGYQTTFNPDWGEYRPGTLIFVHVVKEAIREGLGAVDMLRAGGYDWKNTWQTDETFEHELLVGRGLRGRLWLLAARLTDLAQAAARRLLPDSARRQINALLSRGG